MSIQSELEDWYKYDIPFVPSSDQALEEMMELADIKKGDKAADLGCGEGKLVIAMAKRGAEVDGYEIDSGRYKISKINVQKEKLENSIKIYNANFWKVDVSFYDVITIYGVGSIMKRLEDKLLHEAREGSRVISNMFQFPGWSSVKKIGQSRLYIVR